MSPFLHYNYNFQFNSQKCNNNSIFFALETGVRSGMEFAENAIAHGAKIIISQKPISGMNLISINDITPNTANANIVVEDTLLFMQNLAKQKFDFLKKNGTKTIGVTGSVGKTTTKEFISSTLSQYGKTYATEGNYNNHIGLPLTILNSPLDANFLILEMGMNHAGEIALLTEIAPCEWNIITNVKESHAGNFLNGEQGVLHAKFEIMSGGKKCFVTKETYARFIADDTLQKLYDKTNLHCVESEPNAIIGNGQTSFMFKERTFTLNGIYSNTQTEMLCTAIALMEDILGKPVEKVLLPQIKGRGNIIIWQGVKIINESYNASPTSIKNALENLKTLSGRKLCIVGEMRELGTQSHAYHKSLEQHLQGFDGMILVGKEMQSVNVNNAEYFEDYTACLNFLKNNIKFITSFDYILVKASNGVGLWKLFDNFFV